MQAVYANNVKEAFNLQRSNEEIANKLISDLKSSGIRLGEQMNISYFTSVRLILTKNIYFINKFYKLYKF